MTRARVRIETRSVAETYLALLKDRGVDHLYVGAGTDTAPVIEAYARAESAGLDFPEPILAVHENLAVGMAHGYYLVSGRPQAVMLHVSVGAANAVCALMNAARARVPVFFTAGRTPLFEQGRLGSRSHEVHWAQEMYDQGGMLRELVKWDYELRDGLHVEQVVDRALSISMAEPRGPIYLTLPREVLAQEHAGCTLGSGYPGVTEPAPDPEAVVRLAQRLAESAAPVIVCGSSGANAGTVALLVALADRYGIGVVQSKPRYMNFPDTHPLHLGFGTEASLRQSDAMVFLDCDVPWIPALAEPAATAYVAQVGVDPLYAAYPMRSFRADLNLAATPASVLKALLPALEAAGADRQAAERRARALAAAEVWRDGVAHRQEQDERDGAAPITKRFLSRCLEAVRPRDAIVFNEYPLVREELVFDEPGTFFQLPSSGGLGWGLPAALGAQQAAPDRVVIAALGDGAYMFANPSACHQAAAMHDLPVLIVVFNNECWEGVHQAVQGMYPGAHTDTLVKAQRAAPLSSLKPVPDFERYVEASGGYGERVTRRDQLLPALRRALDAVRNERRQALLNVIGV